MIRLAIVEDEIKYQKLLSQMVIRYGKEKEKSIVVTTFSDGKQFLKQFPVEFDVILLDIDMPGMNGMDTAKEIRWMDSEVILMFVTNLAQYAVNGYEVGALDFIVKPFNYYAFSMRMNRIIRKINGREKMMLTVQTQSGFKRIPISSICYFEVRHHRVTIHTEEETYEIAGALNALKKTLEGQPFIRCNNCFLVNLRYVMGVDKDMVTVGKDNLKISRPRKKIFIQAVADYLGGTV